MGCDKIALWCCVCFAFVYAYCIWCLLIFPNLHCVSLNHNGCLVIFPNLHAVSFNHNTIIIDCLHCDPAVPTIVYAVLLIHTVSQLDFFPLC